MTHTALFWHTLPCYFALPQSNCGTQDSVTAHETSWERVFDPVYTFLFDLYNQLGTNVHFSFSLIWVSWVWYPACFQRTGSTPAWFQEAVRAVWYALLCHWRVNTTIKASLLHIVYTRMCLRQQVRRLHQHSIHDCPVHVCTTRSCVWHEDFIRVPWWIH